MEVESCCGKLIDIWSARKVLNGETSFVKLDGTPLQT